jgi:cephalosporin hydroxylase
MTVMMPTLFQFFNESEHSSDKWDGYFGVYEKHLCKFPLVGHPLTVVEVGVQQGGSLDMWSKYFPKESKIIGIDNNPECAKLKYSNPDIKVVIGDQGDPAFWDKFFTDHPDPIDVFIDDGGHFMDQQITTFEKVFPRIAQGGVYICEDCHTSYMPYNGGGLHRKGTWIEYAKSYADTLHKDWHQELDTEQERRNRIGEDLTSVAFYDSMAVFEKNGKRRLKRVFPK